MTFNDIMFVVNIIKIRIAINEVKHDRQAKGQLTWPPLYCMQSSYKILERAPYKVIYLPMMWYAWGLQQQSPEILVPVLITRRNGAEGNVSYIRFGTKYLVTESRLSMYLPIYLPVYLSIYLLLPVALNPIQSRWDSFGWGSACWEAATYTKNNTNTK
jgi:hypothetical protein